MIQNGKSELSKKVQLDDISRALGLAKSTISRAISGKGRVSTETRKRVRKYIEEHNYRPNVIARSLAQSKTYNLGVVLPADTDLAEKPFFQVFLIGVCEVAAVNDYDVVVTVVMENDMSALKRLVDNNKVDGIILTRLLVNDLAAEYLKTAGIPFVVVGSNDDREIIQIDTDHVTACCKMTDYLLATGNQSMALLIGSDEHTVNRSRYRGYLKAFADRGLEADMNLIFGNLVSRSAIERSVESAMHMKADCIVCGDDIICSRVLTKLHEAGFSVPEDVKVASYYDSAFLQYHNPPITALDIDVKQLGVVTGQSLIDLIARKEVIHRTILNYEIVIKKSTQ